MSGPMRKLDFYGYDAWGRDLTEDEPPRGLVPVYKDPVDLPAQRCPLHEPICPLTEHIKRANGHPRP